MSRSQAAYDLAELVEAGLLERLGGGRATRYRPVRKSRPAQRRWTSERIHSELTNFCAGRKAWPSASAFKAAGRADLYVAASRYGGIGFWAVELGFPRPGRAAAEAPEPRLGRKLAWAGGGALAAALLVAGAAAVVVLSLPHGSARTAGPSRVSPPAATGDRIIDESSHTLGKSRTTPARTAKTVRRAHSRSVRRKHTAPAEPTTRSGTATLITYSPPSNSGSSGIPAGHTSTAAPTASAGPNPLRAPLTASAPSPLKAP